MWTTLPGVPHCPPRAQTAGRRQALWVVGSARHPWAHHPLRPSPVLTGWLRTETLRPACCPCQVYSRAGRNQLCEAIGKARSNSHKSSTQGAFPVIKP